MAASVSTHASNYTPETHSSSTPPNYLGATNPGSQLNGYHDPEKIGYHNMGPIVTENEKERSPSDGGEDEDMDALIDDLESEDGAINDEADEKTEAGAARPVAEELLQTSTTHGLADAEVLVRRKKFGLNQMKEEKQNMILKFLGYFVGPIQFVMEVCFLASFTRLQSSGLPRVYETYLLQLETERTYIDIFAIGSCYPRCWSARLDRSWRYHRPSHTQCLGWLHPGISGRLHR